MRDDLDRDAPSCTDTPAEEGAGRRSFLRTTAGGALALLAGCGTHERAPATTAGASTSGGAGGHSGAGSGTSGSGTSTGGAGGAPPTPACDDTEDNIEGPYYKAGAPERNVLIDDATEGVRLHLSGRVMRAADCAALAGAHLDFWQADHAAIYDQAGFNFRGQFAADAEGRYTLETIIPGHYLNGAQYRPAHIHVKVSAAGHTLLTTQLYFEGDPYNAIDPFIHESLIMTLTDAPDGSKSAEFDFVLV
jgi:protocatechuate 3,4-dioxygenase beta subunit